MAKSIGQLIKIYHLAVRIFVYFNHNRKWHNIILIFNRIVNMNENVRIFVSRGTFAFSNIALKVDLNHHRQQQQQQKQWKL